MIPLSSSRSGCVLEVEESRGLDLERHVRCSWPWRETGLCVVHDSRYRADLL